MKKLVVLSGAGISAESGIKTFRDHGGLWENYSIEDVASIEGWKKNPQLVLDFYNARRRQLSTVSPNEAHQLLADLQNDFNVEIITQNVDDLHERAGSKNILHLHGELLKSRSEINENLIYDYDKDIQIGDKASDGGQLRPYIVWFGELVPKLEEAAQKAMQADIFLVIGTSLQVYPAAGLINYIPPHASIYVIDPHKPDIYTHKNITFIEDNAVNGMKKFIQELN